MASMIFAVAVAWICAQVVLKPLIESFKRGRFVPESIWQRGGMPSGHSALVGALCAAIAKVDGLQSPLFVISLVFSLLVLYDALVTRRILTRQADILQTLTKKNVDRIFGHEPVEVFAGVLLGVLIAWYLI